MTPNGSTVVGTAIFRRVAITQPWMWAPTRGLEFLELLDDQRHGGGAVAVANDGLRIAGTLPVSSAALFVAGRVVFGTATSGDGRTVLLRWDRRGSVEILTPPAGLTARAWRVCQTPRSATLPMMTSCGCSTSFMQPRSNEVGHPTGPIRPGG